MIEVSLVIPVRNDPEGLKRLLLQVQDLKVFSEIIICDDASEEAIPLDLWELSSAFRDRISCSRSEHQRGAGHARNSGLQRVSTSHVVFFDSDDLFEDGFLRIVQAINKSQGTEEFDFCIFRHHDSRVLATGGEGSYPKEEGLWLEVEAQERPTPLTPGQSVKLCGLAAYPWNKIYRTDFLRVNDIRCSELPVHNDLELHWTSFLTAKRILCTSIIGATHYVLEDGSRLTNKRDEDRLRVFEAFDAVQARLNLIEPYRRINFLEPFMSFVRNLLIWIRDNMEKEHHDALIKHARRFFLKNIDGDIMTIIAFRNPVLAGSINNIIVNGILL